MSTENFKLVVYRILNAAAPVYLMDGKDEFVAPDDPRVTNLNDEDAKSTDIVRFVGEIHKAGHKAKDGSDILSNPNLTLNARKWRHPDFNIEFPSDSEIVLTVPEFDRAKGDSTTTRKIDRTAAKVVATSDYFAARQKARLDARIAAEKAAKEAEKASAQAQS